METKHLIPRWVRSDRAWRRNASLVAGLTLLIGLAQDVTAADTYPDRPVKIVVPYAPGGANDLVARLFGERMSRELGQAVVVENRPGAGGSLGTEGVARATPDGYTLLMGAGGALTINPSLYPNLRYDPLRDFTPIAMTATSPLVVVVNPALPVHDIKGLVAYAATRPEGITFASAGNGTPLHLAAELFKHLTGAKMTHVPYQGGGPALVDLLAGRIDVMFDTPGTSAPYISAQKLRAIGVTSIGRNPLLPDVPTLHEQGIKGFDVTVWYGFFAPTGTPPNVLEKLQATISHIGTMPDMRSRLAGLSLSPADEGSEALKHRIEQEIPRWARIVKQSGAKIE